MLSEEQSPGRCCTTAGMNTCSSSSSSSSSSSRSSSRSSSSSSSCSSSSSSSPRCIAVQSPSAEQQLDGCSAPSRCCHGSWVTYIVRCAVCDVLLGVRSRESTAAQQQRSLCVGAGHKKQQHCSGVASFISITTAATCTEAWKTEAGDRDREVFLVSSISCTTRRGYLPSRAASTTWPSYHLLPSLNAYSLNSFG